MTRALKIIGILVAALLVDSDRPTLHRECKQLPAEAGIHSDHRAGTRSKSRQSRDYPFFQAVCRRKTCPSPTTLHSVKTRLFAPRVCTLAWN